MGNVQPNTNLLSMTDTISYQYAAPSTLQRSADQDELFRAKYSEIEKREAPCFFWGKLTQPYMAVGNAHPRTRHHLADMGGAGF